MSARYPVRAPRDPYTGRQERYVRRKERYNSAADAIIQHINTKMAAEPDDTAHEFVNVLVAVDLGLDHELVDLIMFRIGGGHVAQTVIKGSPHVSDA